VNAEFQWWLLIFGIVIGGALVYLVMADLRSDDRDEMDPDSDLDGEPAEPAEPGEPEPERAPGSDAALTDDDPSSQIEPRSAP
jgi:hypothetical protein